jgi:hypothetical protein
MKLNYKKFTFGKLLAFCLAACVVLIYGCSGSNNTDSKTGITRLDIISTETASFGGTKFGAVGTYDKIFAKAYGVVDPTDRRNALITDINLAPKNANGLVEYSMDVHIFKPTDMAKGNNRIFYDVVNRGNKGHSFFNDVGPNNPSTAADAGNGLLMRLGYTMVFSGWEDESLVAPGGDRALAKLPIAKNKDGSSVVENTITEVIFDAPTGNQIPLSYPAANLDQSQAKMLVHNHSKFGGTSLIDRVEVPKSVWSYVDNKTVQVDRKNAFLAAYDQGAAFEFVYPAKDPVVLGLGFAATRDVVSFLKNDTSNLNPIRNSIKYAISHGSSQSGRYLKGFLYWGFNEDSAGRMVFEGIQPKISGAHAIASNDRFGDSNATGRSYQRELSSKMEFPFTYEVRFDPVSVQTDGIFNRCQLTNTCPKIMHTDSGNEAFLKANNLVTTDGLGRDISLPQNVRVYLVSGTQHGPSATAAVTPTCQQLSNPNPHNEVVRALFVALDDWATKGVEPPPSQYPKIGDGTSVASLPQSNAFPKIPGVNYTGFYIPVAVKDKTSLPNIWMKGKEYVVTVPKTDADGNEVAGVLNPNVKAPLGTYTGWSLRRAPFAENEDCALTGQYIPFPLTKASRISTGDPRLSIEERYPTKADYVSAVGKAVDDLVRNRYLLAEDGDKFKATAASKNIYAP